MKLDVVECGNLGMSQDLSISKADNKLAFENRNIRITAVNDNTLLSITNEKGPSEVEGSTSIEGCYKAHCIIDDTLVLFTSKTAVPLLEFSDYIYVIKLSKTGDTMTVKLLYSGNLKLGDNIDTIGYYEASDVRKVYWVDGVNSPRVINIDKEYTNNESLDFMPVLHNFSTIKVEKDFNGEGIFEAGTIQYAITYYNKYGAETAISNITPLIYITEENNGLDINNKTSCNFNITITNIDTSFEYMRVYSIKRTTLNGPFTVNIVKDVPVVSSTISIIDNNTNQESIDPNLLYYIGGNDFIAKTISHKDNTLFVGNITTKGTIVNDDIEDDIKNNWYTDIKDKDGNITYRECNVISEIYKTVNTGNYKNTDAYYVKDTSFINNNIKGFKSSEIYRFAIQFQSEKGQWSAPIYIGDKKQTKFPKTSLVNYNVVNYIPVFEFNNSIFFENVLTKQLKDIYKDIRAFRVLRAETTYENRSVLAQGIISPTIFNYKQRCDNAPYVISSPIMRDNTNRNWCNLANEIRGTKYNSIAQNETNTDIKKDSYAIILIFEECVDYICKKLKCSINATKTNNTDYGVILHTFAIDNDKYNNTELVTNINNILTSYNCAKVITEAEIINLIKYLNNEIESAPSGWIKYSKYSYSCEYIINDTIPEKCIDSSNYQNKQSEFFVDTSIITFHSPELDKEELSINDDVKFRLVGIAPITANKADVSLNVENPMSSLGGLFKDNIYKYNYPNISKNVKPLTKDRLYIDASWNYSSDKKSFYPDSSITKAYNVFMWDKTGSLIGQTDGTIKNSSGDSWGEEKKSIIKNKIFANKRFSLYTKYLNIKEDINITNVQTFNSESIDAKRLNILNKDIYYYGNYDFLNTYLDSYSVDGTYTNEIKSYAPVRIKYKSTPHAVFGLLNSDKTKMLKLPYIIGEAPASEYSEVNKKYLWLSNIFGSQDLYSTDSINQSNIEYPDSNYLFIGELYRDINYSSLYGGLEDTSLQKLRWLPASEIYNIYTSYISTIYIYGDTFYERYDCLKTYPFSEEEQNSVVDVTSVMLETHINTAATYNTAKDSLTNIRPTSLKLNTIYNQEDNVFVYSILDNKYKNINYPNQIIWSLQKTTKENIDNWTNITLTSSLDLDGTKGNVTKLITYQDKLLAFQPKAISSINYNNRTALSTVEGVPIEIVNSGLVNGYTIISDSIGLSNIKEIVKASSGIYFIDIINKQVYCLNNNGLSTITSKGLEQWFKEQCSYNSIKDTKEKAFTVCYDYLTKDVYFINYNHCITYNEVLQQFTSFMPYSNISALFNILGYSYFISNNISIMKLFKMFGGDYNKDKNGQFIPYSITYRINPNNIDNVFTNIEFTADLLKSDYTIDSKPNNSLLSSVPFDKLTVWNEYQYGESNITPNYGVSNIKQKYRRWRLDIPRDSNSKYKIDRIRNPWCYIKLEKTPTDSNKLIFHNLLVKYYK